MSEQSKSVDWASIEAAYRDGVMTIRQIADDHGCSEGAVRKRAKKDGWVRSELTAYRAAAAAAANDRTVPPSTYVNPDLPPDQRLLEVASAAGAIVASHRRGAHALRTLLGAMAGEMIEHQQMMPIIEERLEEFYMQKAAGNPLNAAIYRQQMMSALNAVSLNGRSKSILNLTNAMAKLVEIERVSWNLKDEADGRTYEDILKEVHERALNERVKPLKQLAA